MVSHFRFFRETVKICRSSARPATVQRIDLVKIGGMIASFLGPLVIKYPWIAVILSVMGTARLVIKPIFSVAHIIVNQTTSNKDNQILDKIEQSKAYRAITWLFDYLFSIKLIGKK